MADTGKPDICLLVCWGFGVLAGILAFLWVMTGLALPAALMFCGGLAVLTAVALSRMACTAGVQAGASEALATTGGDRAGAKGPANPAGPPDPTLTKGATLQRPAALSAPRGGSPDALQRIKGIGPALERACHGLGIYHFDQIAAWSEFEVAWVEDRVKGARGRVTRDDWVGQARALAEDANAEDAKTPDENHVMDRGDGAGDGAVTRPEDKGT